MPTYAQRPTLHFFFQNPNTGYPMVLTEGEDERPVVELEEGSPGEAEPSETDFADARTYSQAVQHFTDLYDAARYIALTFGAKDILS